MLVDVRLGASADAGSIPAASTFSLIQTPDGQEAAWVFADSWAQPAAYGTHLSSSAALHEAELQLHPVTAFETATDARDWIDQSVNAAPIGF